MDHILVKGDANYKLLGTFDILSVDELLRIVSDEEFNFSVEFMSLENGEISANSVGFPFLRAIYNSCVDRGDGFLMFLCGFTIVIIPYRNFFYLFDSHSRNGQGEMIGSGKSVLLEFSHLEDIENYIQVVYMQQRSQSHTYFQIQCVKINISIENRKLMVLSNFQRKHRNAQRMNQRKVVRERSLNFKSSASNSIKRRGDPEKKSPKKLRKCTSDSSRVEIFKKKIQDGPYHICVVCNRCLYRRSVIHFDEHRYVYIVEGLNTEITPFDGLLYIGKTCDKKLKSSKVSCQAVLNKLQIFDLPKEYSDIRKGFSSKKITV